MTQATSASTLPDLPGTVPLASIALAGEPDIVRARQLARQLARLLGLDNQDQIRVATATSEIARNAFQYAGSGEVAFSVQTQQSQSELVVQVVDSGRGIASVEEILKGNYRSATGMGLGIAGTRRIMDRFVMESAPGQGTRVLFAKLIPGPPVTAVDSARVREQVAREGAGSNGGAEVQQQNRDLLSALSLLQKREAELDDRRAELGRLNQELEDTNRGVVALYAELDEKAEALRAANEIKSRFLSHMSHEFRTPLNSILALTKLLQRRVDGHLTPDQERQVGYIRAAAQELSEMVNDLLDLAKVEAGKVELKTSRVDVSHLFGTLRGMLRPLATNDAVTLTIEEPPGKLHITTDEGKLGQILRNLVSNALKFTERGEIRVAARVSGDRVLFSVSDTGIGIAPEHQRLIFQDFAQIDNAIQRRVKGTGLGLPLSRKLAQLLGGELTVESTLGAGSEFTLDLPLSETAPEVTSSLPPKPLDTATAGDCILIIDDEEIARYLARQMFRGSRYRLIEAASASEGAERARFEKPSLILLDLSMPGQSGFDALDELKSDPSTAGIPVVIHTSKALRPEDLERLKGRHAAIMPKQPVGREPAQEFIRQLLGEPQLFS